MTGPGRPVPHAFLTLPPPEGAPARVAILPVPYDATASFRAGAREGPAAIIAASAELEEYDTELRCEPSRAGIETAPALEPYLGDPHGMVERVTQAVLGPARAGQLVGVLGGDHSVAIGAASAFAALHPDLSVLYLDAHADLRDDYQGTRWGHASAARRILEVCPLVLAGVRSMSREEADLLRSGRVVAFPWGEGDPPLSASAVAAALTPTVYVSVDLDVLDPALMPAVGTPEPGGLSWAGLLGLLRGVAERRRIVGFDVVELTPREGPAACASTAAKLVYKIIGYATALGPQGAR